MILLIRAVTVMAVRYWFADTCALKACLCPYYRRATEGLNANHLFPEGTTSHLGSEGRLPECGGRARMRWMFNPSRG